MLIRDYFSRQVVFLLSIMAISFIYSTSKKIRYSNCKINNPALLEIVKDNKIIFAIIDKNIKKQIQVKFNKIALPDPESDDECEQKVHDLIKTKIYQMSNYNGMLKLSDCRPRITETDGVLFSDGQNVENYLIKNKFLPKKRYFKFLKKINWCGYK